MREKENQSGGKRRQNISKINNTGNSYYSKAIKDNN